MKFPYNFQEAQERLMVLVEEMNGESERAIAIVGSAWVEEALLDAITFFLEEHNKAAKELFSTGRPLSTFSAKIHLARLLGIISDAIWSDLNMLRKIRNEFAHQIAHKEKNTKISFSEIHIRDMCFAFNCVKHESHTDPRTAFTRACAILNTDLEMFTMVSPGISGADRIDARAIGEA